MIGDSLNVMKRPRPSVTAEIVMGKAVILVMIDVLLRAVLMMSAEAVASTAHMHANVNDVMRVRVMLMPNASVEPLNNH